MTYDLKNLWIGVEISKESKCMIKHISDDIKHLLESECLNCKIPHEHHMTFGYFKHITEHHLANILSSIDTLKEKHKHTQLINRWLDYDETLHKIELWESNINERLYIVLKPHNPNPIFLEFIQQQHISPHISLAEITWSSLEQVKHLLPKIKQIRDLAVETAPITVDLSKVHISF